MKQITHFFFLSCLKATELIEKKFYIQLSFKENLQLKIHKMMCEACAKYEKHSRLIDSGISKLGKTSSTEIDVEDLKIKINGLLDKK